MASNTPLTLRNKIIYCVYVRNHTPEGTFLSVIPDLDRIKSLGTDIIWFMPIHPIGVKDKKGSLGCPYSVRDYRAVNPYYGTMDDFKRLVDEIHSRSMKCMIDIVYNHTSPDSVLTQEHPQWFYRDKNGNISPRVADWSDVRDLDYSHEDLWKYQCDTLTRWAHIVDGFRCDVAQLVPVPFWQMARDEVSKVNSECIWLAESADSGFVRYGREQGWYSASDGELYNAFDITYDYDIRDFFYDYASGKIPLSTYLYELNRQECVYPANYAKLRYLENHDLPRARHTFPDLDVLKQWTAFMYFQRGTALIYAGQEFANDNTPSLFEKDTIDRTTGVELSDLLSRLALVKRLPIVAHGSYSLTDAGNDIVYGKYSDSDHTLTGIFSLKGNKTDVRTDLPDGVYQNMVNGQAVAVRNGRITCDTAVIIYN